ncbi:MAG TPA: hypothetical protein VM638_06580 [Actinomycetota bacterium]|nr:hypothetical protein [Actinomycetota bacterium]
MIRSILAVVAGYLAMFIGVSIFFTFVVFFAWGGKLPDPATYTTPPSWLLYAELAWVPLVSVAGGWVCAFVARSRPMRHAAALVAIMAPLTAVSIVGEWGMKPVWSLLGVPVLGMAGVLLGARLYRAV